MRFYTVQEVMDILRLTRRSVYNYLELGEIKAIKVGREWRIPTEEIEKFIERGGTSQEYMEKLREYNKRQRKTD